MKLELGKDYFIHNSPLLDGKNLLRIRLSSSWIIISIEKLGPLIEKIKTNPPHFYTENDVQILEELVKRHGCSDNNLREN